MTVDEILAEILKDRPFFEDSGGGVTFSGGEPLMDPEFLLRLLMRCRAEGIHSAVDTCGHVPRDALDAVRDWVDLFLYDVKLMDSERHRAFTGVPNDLLLDNLRHLASHHPRILARMPVVPGYNDDPENVDRTGALLADLGIGEIQILPYHATAAQKYARLGREYRVGDVPPPTTQRITEVARQLEAHGLKVHVGGHGT
jgi:pyruvate formate lyase activating enzyme